MKHMPTVLILIALMLIAACGPKPGLAPSSVHRRTESGDDLFRNAEDQFQREEYQEAQEAYQKYVQQYPKGQWAAAALVKLGAVYRHQGQWQEALDSNYRVVREYPESPFAMDARIEILDIYLSLGDYHQIVFQTPSVLAEDLSDQQRVKTLVILGDAYRYDQQPVDAITNYQAALPLASYQAEQTIHTRLKSAIGQLKRTDADLLLDSTEGLWFRADLMYRLGVIQAMEGAAEKALETLTVFMDEYPQHEDCDQAALLIDELSQQFYFEPYTIGCLLPLSGPYKAYGQKALQGIELAFSRREESSGGSPFKLIIRDTQSDPGKAVIAVKELADAGVGVILGPIATAEPACKAAQEHSLPIIAITQKAHLTDIGDYVFRNFITPEMQAETIASYAIEELGMQRFAILYPDEVYGLTFMKFFWEAVLSRGGSITAIESYDPQKTDFAGPIKRMVGVGVQPPKDILKARRETAALYRLKQPPPPFVAELTNLFGDHAARYMGLPPSRVSGRKPVPGVSMADGSSPVIQFDAIFIPDSPKKAGLIIPQLAYYDIKGVTLLGTNLWHSPRMIRMSRKYVQGAILPEGFFASSRSPLVKAFVDQFSATYGNEPGIIEASFFDTANMAFQILEDPELQLRTQAKARLLELAPYIGVTGRTRFRENGEVFKELYLLQVKGAKFMELERTLSLYDYPRPGSLESETLTETPPEEVKTSVESTGVVE